MKQRNNIVFKKIDKSLTTFDLMNDVMKVAKQNKDLKAENERIRMDVSDYKFVVNKKDEYKRLLNDLTKFHAENMKEKNKRINYLERKLNHVIYDQVKALAIVLAEELDGFVYSEYQKEINPNKYQLNDREKKAYREYANLLLGKKGFIY